MPNCIKYVISFYSIISVQTLKTHFLNSVHTCEESVQVQTDFSTNQTAAAVTAGRRKKTEEETHPALGGGATVTMVTTGSQHKSTTQTHQLNSPSGAGTCSFHTWIQLLKHVSCSKIQDGRQLWRGHVSSPNNNHSMSNHSNKFI